ncbi:SAUR auxin-responsive family protein [Theobroma cacao]|uniref:SAUR auxin-responsive family protein n=1 Tax=Theobroma cacao TaxID=3641 RepID=A0A061DYM2_THECC|nr:SAUR auxin-responsive family protein [Theobroma cacao]
MISTKILIRMARKWQKTAAIGRKRLASSRTDRKMAGANRSNKSSVVDKGHFVIYTTDKKRFLIPLAYLCNNIILELLKMSEEEFGLPSDGPITLPCDSVVMNYIVSLVKRGLTRDLEKAVVNSVASYRCSTNTTYFHQGHADQRSSSIFCVLKPQDRKEGSPPRQYVGSQTCENMSMQASISK